MRTLIGLTTYDESAAWGAWNRRAVLLPIAYVEAVRRAGGVPVLLPPLQDVEEVDRVLSAVDGLVVSGGNDLDPAVYGAEPHERTTRTRPQRDGAEIALVVSALRREVPVLGICRGLQVLNVARGGDLVQHLPDVVGDDRHLPAPGAFATHRVRTAPGSLAARVLGEELDVQSSHHQGVGRLGAGLVATGWAPDGTVEVCEMPAHGFVLGLQWHPEEDPHPGPLTALVAAAGRMVAP